MSSKQQNKSQVSDILWRLNDFGSFFRRVVRRHTGCSMGSSRRNPFKFQTGASLSNLPSRDTVTLIEVMITVAIVAFLAAIALPSYQDYVLGGHLVDATNSASAPQVDMERHFQDNRTHVDAGKLKPPCPATPAHFNKAEAAQSPCGGTSTAAAYTPRAEEGVWTKGLSFALHQPGTKATTISDVGGPGDCVAALILVCAHLYPAPFGMGALEIDPAAMLRDRGRQFLDVAHRHRDDKNYV